MAVIYSSVIHQCFCRYCSLDSLLTKIMDWIYSEFLNRDDLSKTIKCKRVSGRVEICAFLGFLAPRR